MIPTPEESQNEDIGIGAVRFRSWMVELIQESVKAQIDSQRLDFEMHSTTSIRDIKPDVEVL